MNTNGHSYVDLGLPSGTLWATKPIMSQDNEPLYFAWGGIQGMTRDYIEKIDFLFGFINNQIGSVVPYMSDEFTPTKYNVEDGKAVLDLEDDAAHVHMGGDWHMPTKEQLRELTANTTSTWTTQKGVNGRLFTSKINGNSVFVPAFGDAYDGAVLYFGSDASFWSSSLNSDNVTNAWSLNFGSDYLYVYDYGRPFGFCVLGVVG